MCPALVQWTIEPPSDAELAAHVAPHGRKRKAVPERLPRRSPLPHRLKMRFIHVLVGKMTHAVPIGKLTTTLHFADGQGAFQQFRAQVCGMSNVSEDLAFRTVALSAQVQGVAAQPHPAPPKVYELSPHFELVTPREVPPSVRAELSAAHVHINTHVTDDTSWGPRVQNYCESTRFALFQ